MPDVIPGGSPRNPMGVAAMTLAGGEYAIHGTNMPGSVGGFVSYGCIRMLNDDITDLYQRVSVGTTVVVTPLILHVVITGWSAPDSTQSRAGNLAESMCTGAGAQALVGVAGYSLAARHSEVVSLRSALRELPGMT